MLVGRKDIRLKYLTIEAYDPNRALALSLGEI